MRTPYVALLLCVPLLAGGPGGLGQAVARFGDERPRVRDAASEEAARIVRENLAPLLAAMESEDPEVARRARAVVRSLLPWEREPDEEAAPETAFPRQLLRQLVVNRRGRGGQALQVVANGGVLFVGGPEEEVRAENLRAFGLSGYEAFDPLLRRHLRLGAGRGYVVDEVTQGSDAMRFGLRSGDILLRIGERPVMNVASVDEALGPNDGWAMLTFHLVRDGELLTLPPAPR